MRRDTTRHGVSVMLALSTSACDGRGPLCIGWHARCVAIVLNGVFVSLAERQGVGFDGEGVHPLGTAARMAHIHGIVVRRCRCRGARAVVVLLLDVELAQQELLSGRAMEMSGGCGSCDAEGLCTATKQCACAPH